MGAVSRGLEGGSARSIISITACKFRCVKRRLEVLPSCVRSRRSLPSACGPWHPALPQVLISSGWIVLANVSTVPCGMPRSSRSRSSFVGPASPVPDLCSAHCGCSCTSFNCRSTKGMRMTFVESARVSNFLHRFLEQPLTNTPDGQVQMIGDFLGIDPRSFPPVSFQQISTHEFDLRRLQANFATGQCDVILVAGLRDVAREYLPIAQQHDPRLRRDGNRSVAAREPASGKAQRPRWIRKDFRNMAGGRVRDLPRYVNAYAATIGSRHAAVCLTCPDRLISRERPHSQDARRRPIPRAKSHPGWLPAAPMIAHVDPLWPPLKGQELVIDLASSYVVLGLGCRASRVPRTGRRRHPRSARHANHAREIRPRVPPARHPAQSCPGLDQPARGGGNLPPGRCTGRLTVDRPLTILALRDGPPNRPARYTKGKATWGQYPRRPGISAAAEAAVTCEIPCHVRFASRARVGFPGRQDPRAAPADVRENC